MERKILACYTDWNRPGAKGKYGGVGWYRIVNPFTHMDAHVLSGEELGIGGKERHTNAQKMADLAKTWVFKYVDDINPVLHLLSARDTVGAKLWIDIDDDMFHVHPHNYAYNYHYPGSPKNETLKYLVKEADGLIVSTEPLREVMKEYNKNIIVAPNAIDPEIWKVPLEKNTGKRLRIGWILSANHEQDVPEIRDAMNEILRKYNVEFRAIGYYSDDFNVFPKKKRKFVLGTKGYDQYPQFLAKQRLDISIAPLIDDEFNRGKSNIKWMESSMVGVPVVASDREPYKCIENAKTGFLAKNKKEWVKYLSMLIEDAEMRKEIAENAKKKVLKDYHIKSIIKHYEGITL